MVLLKNQIHIPSSEHMILGAKKWCGSTKVTLTKVIAVCQNYSGPQ